MTRLLTCAASVVLMVGSAAFAEIYEVEMLNKGSDGERMVFEPDFLQIEAGDTVKFVPTDRGHNAVSMDGMIPEGAEPFEGKINQELDVTFETEGLYGILCKPHFSMGMVMTVEVGDVEEAPEDFLEGRIPRKAKERFEAQLENL